MDKKKIIKFLEGAIDNVKKRGGVINGVHIWIADGMMRSAVYKDGEEVY